ncbi:hypothetical protein V0M98_33760 (plasmid) [Pseudomonas silesiensis]|uniref:hypothetical protein n=1 Tax=Pseudomonas silesiensis TaxID=1853130 RepID=UPI0030CE6293
MKFFVLRGRKKVLIGKARTEVFDCRSECDLLAQPDLLERKKAKMEATGEYESLEIVSGEASSDGRRITVGESPWAGKKQSKRSKNTSKP